MKRGAMTKKIIAWKPRAPMTTAVLAFRENNAAGEASSNTSAAAEQAMAVVWLCKMASATRGKRGLVPRHSHVSEI